MRLRKAAETKVCLDKAMCVRCCDWDWDEEQDELLYVFLQDLDAVLGGLVINVITTGRVALVLYGVQ